MGWGPVAAASPTQSSAAPRLASYHSSLPHTERKKMGWDPPPPKKTPPRPTYPSFSCPTSSSVGTANMGRSPTARSRPAAAVTSAGVSPPTNCP